MSLLALPDDVPFMFGPYATYVRQNAPAEQAPKAPCPEPGRPALDGPTSDAERAVVATEEPVLDRR